MNKRALGSLYEEMAVDFLKKQGYFILTRNFSCKIGEIDIIARDKGYLVFVEVKYRKNNANGIPEEAVTPAKIRKICKTADYFRVRNGYGEETPCRFDVVAIQGSEIRLYENAFTYL